MSTAAGKRHMTRIKRMGCVVCGAPPPSYAHHIRTGQGMSQRASDFLTLPLCYECHQGKSGIHGDRSAWRLRKLSELDALAYIIETLGE